MSTDLHFVWRTRYVRTNKKNTCIPADGGHVSCRVWEVEAAVEKVVVALNSPRFTRVDFKVFSEDPRFDVQPIVWKIRGQLVGWPKTWMNVEAWW